MVVSSVSVNCSPLLYDETLPGTVHSLEHNRQSFGFGLALGGFGLPALAHTVHH